MQLKVDLSFRFWLLIREQIISNGRQLVMLKQGTISIVFDLIEGIYLSAEALELECLGLALNNTDELLEYDCNFKL